MEAVSFEDEINDVVNVLPRLLLDLRIDLEILVTELSVSALVLGVVEMTFSFLGFLDNE